MMLRVQWHDNNNNNNNRGVLRYGTVVGYLHTGTDTMAVVLVDKPRRLTTVMITQCQPIGWRREIHIT